MKQLSEQEIRSIVREEINKSNPFYKMHIPKEFVDNCKFRIREAGSFSGIDPDGNVPVGGSWEAGFFVDYSYERHTGLDRWSAHGSGGDKVIAVDNCFQDFVRDLSMNDNLLSGKFSEDIKLGICDYIRSRDIYSSKEHPWIKNVLKTLSP